MDAHRRLDFIKCSRAKRRAFPSVCKSPETTHLFSPTGLASAQGTGAPLPATRPGLCYYGYPAQKELTVRFTRPEPGQGLLDH